MDGFSRNEIIGRNKWHKYQLTIPSITKVSYSEDTYAHYDTVYYENNVPVLGEIKNRTCKSTDYNQYFYLEKLKYDELNKLISSPKAKDLNTKITYINFTSDSKMIIWDLTNMNITDWVLEWLPKQECGDRTLVQKLVHHLDASLGTIIDLNTGEVILSERQELEQLLKAEIDEDEIEELPFQAILFNIKDYI